MKVKVTKAPIYTYLFDKNSAAWDDDYEKNKYFLLMQLCYMNEKLKAVGYIFLNEVFDCLGLPRTKRGQVVGWIYDKNNTNGDNYIDFGLAEQHKGVNGAVVLNFNVDGIIWDKF